MSKPRQPAAAAKLADDLRVGLALRELHHLADEEAGRGLLAGLEVGHALRVGGDRLLDERLQGGGVAHRAEPALLHDRLRIASLLEDLREQLLERGAVDRARRGEADERGEVGWLHRALADRLAARVHQRHHVAHEEVAELLGELAVEPLRGGLEPVGVLLVLGEHPGVVLGDAVLLHHPRAASLRQLGEERAPFLDLGLGELHRHQVRLREIPVVVGVLLRTHGGGLHRLRVPAARLLHDRDGVRHAFALAPRLVLERGVDAGEGVHVLDLDLRPQLLRALGPDGDVDVGAHVALLEVAVAHPRVDQHLAERGEIGDRVVGRLHVRLGDDLHQGSAAAVEVDARGGGVVVDLRRVLLEVDVVYADQLLGAVGARDLHPAADAEGTAVLGDLVVLGHVGVEVVLAVKGGVRVHAAAEHQARHNRELHRLAVHDRERTRVAEADGADVGVRLAARLQQAGAEHLGLGPELDVRLEADGAFVFHARVLHSLTLPKMLP